MTSDPSNVSAATTTGLVCAICGRAHSQEVPFHRRAKEPSGFQRICAWDSTACNALRILGIHDAWDFLRMHPYEREALRANGILPTEAARILAVSHTQQ